MEFECSEKRFRIFEDMVEKVIICLFGFYLELVLLGFESGTTPLIRRELEEFRVEIESINLHVRRLKLRFVDLDELPETGEEELEKPYFVARNEERRQKTCQDSYEDKRSYNRDFAIFLDYPGEDVEWFLT